MPLDFNAYGNTDDLPLKLLYLADERIAQPINWVKGTLHTRENGVDAYCLRGALYSDEYKTTLSFQSYEAGVIAAEECIMRSNDLIGVVHFNNAPSTTFKDVKQALTKAIAYRIKALMPVA